MPIEPGASQEPREPADPFAGLGYQRLIDWPARLRRESPFLLQVLQEGPEPSLLDLGCGTGEHAAFCAARGYRVVGLDRSRAQLEQARRHLGDLPLRFVEGDLERPGASLSTRFGTAFCLGNTLVNVQEKQALAATCRAIRDLLLPGGSWVIQILNYARILAQNVRSLPVQILPDTAGELVFLRLMRALPDQRLQFFATALRLRHDTEPPLEIVSSRASLLRTWLQTDLEEALQKAGFASLQWFGDLSRSAFDPIVSSDLVCVARR